MRYAFFGNTEFSATVLNRLVKGGFTPALVVSNPDRPAGRTGAHPPAIEARRDRGGASALSAGAL